ncbi:GntR family transcriptional regulator [Herbaspirillum sp. GCM10030257]|uniref:GntR family transcriptional regulator n=1 Tax=Herbaspirillum sp. GCM10030257 TaxID=3273393 RepID=UPI00360C2925
MNALDSLAKDAITRRQPATVSVADALRGAILKGVLKGGVPLRQDGIAKQFAVSQATVREAFRLLAEEGLVEVTPRKGAVVYSLSAAEVEEITDLRATLECALIEASIPHMGPDDFDAAEAAIKKLEKARTVEEQLALNLEFHEALYRKANKPRTVAILDRLRTSLEPYLRLLWSRTGYRSQSQDDHIEILTLCKENKVKDAQHALRLHVEHTGHEIRSILIPNEGA